MSSVAKWYVVGVYAGLEKKVAAAIRDQADKKGLSDYFEEIITPCEEVIEAKRGLKVTVEKSYLPGYILIKMRLTDESWHLVQNTPRVSGLLGASGKPVPISESEVMNVLKDVQNSIEKPRHSVVYEIGEQVRVIEGPFTSFGGVVEEVDSEKGRLKVSVMIFGRPTPVELEFGQVERS